MSLFGIIWDSDVFSVLFCVYDSFDRVFYSLNGENLVDDKKNVARFHL